MEPRWLRDVGFSKPETNSEATGSDLSNAWLLQEENNLLTKVKVDPKLIDRWHVKRAACSATSSLFLEYGGGVFELSGISSYPSRLLYVLPSALYFFRRYFVFMMIQIYAFHSCSSGQHITEIACGKDHTVALSAHVSLIIINSCKTQRKILTNSTVRTQCGCGELMIGGN